MGVRFLGERERGVVGMIRCVYVHSTEARVFLVDGRERSRSGSSVKKKNLSSLLRLLLFSCLSLFNVPQ